jgi:hypothetical protein
LAGERRQTDGEATCSAGDDLASRLKGGMVTVMGARNCLCWTAEADADAVAAVAYWRAAVATYAASWPQPQQRRLRELTKAGATIAYWQSDESTPARPGLVEHAPGPLNLCHNGTLHATLLPHQWKGSRRSRRWIVALTGKVVGDEVTYGALTREILGEALPLCKRPVSRRAGRARRGDG